MKNIKFGKLLVRLLVLAIIGGAIFYFIKKSQPTQTETEIMSTLATIGNVESTISGSGTLNPANQYEVKSLVKGAILKAPFEEGDLVKKGSLLYQISTSEIANNIKSSELGVEKAKSSYSETLAKKDKLQLYSKESGYIKKLYVKEGDTITAGKVIADIYNPDILYLELLFPSSEVKSNWVNKTAKVTLASTGEIIKGKVTNVSSMIETMTGGILGKKITLEIKNAGGLSSGDTATASITNIDSINSGTFRPATEASITAESDGIVESLLAVEGAWISQEANILTLTSTDLDLQIDNAKIGITEAELALETQRAQEKLYTIYSPISGQVITKNRKQGDTIDPATDTQSGPLAIIYDMTYLTFQMNIDELQISNIKKGQKVSISTEAFPDTSFDGVIDRISLKGNTTNGVTSYPVIVKVAEFGKLLPGMNVNGSIILEKADSVLTIPSSALQEGNIVYLKSAEAAASDDPLVPAGYIAVAVTIGINDGSNVEIKDGLKEDDVVYIPFDNTVQLPDNIGYY